MDAGLSCLSVSHFPSFFANSWYVVFLVAVVYVGWWAAKSAAGCTGLWIAEGLCALLGYCMLSVT